MRLSPRPSSLLSVARGLNTIGLALLFLMTLSAFILVTEAHAQTPPLSKAFAPTTIGPGSSSTLTYTLFNTASQQAVSNVAFGDTLLTGVAIADPANATSDCDGLLSAPDGGNTIAFSGGRLGASESCTITIDVTSSTPGTYTDPTGDLEIFGDPLPLSAASATLTVDAGRPGFSKSFSPNIITPGGISILTLTIDNTANTAAANSLAFTDILPDGMDIATPANASNTCGGTLNTGLTGGGTASLISLFGGTVAASSSCIIRVNVTSASSGTFLNKTGELTSGISPLSSGYATALLNVPREFLTKQFTDDPVAPGDSVTLEFTITNFDFENNGRDISGPFTSIAFTDDLDATLTDLVATGLPFSACGGTVDAIPNAGTIDFSGGSLNPGDSCTFSVPLIVPAGATTGTYANTTSALTFDAGGNSIVGNTATDDLVVKAAPVLTKAFQTNPVGAGGTTTLLFTITNTSSSTTLSNIAFEDVFADVLPTGLVGTNNCGGTATFTPLIEGATSTTPASFTVTGASLGASASCTIEITLDVAVGTAAGTYPNTSSAVTGLLGGEVPVEGLPASDDLIVVGGPSLLKAFTDDPVAPEGTVTLEFTLSHSEDSLAGSVTQIAFTDDLDATLTDLVATGLPFSACGGTVAAIPNAGIIDFSGGSLTPGEVCTFSVTLDVPGTATPGPHTNTTSIVTATVNGIAVTGDPASDDLQIQALTLTKEFTDDPVTAGNTVTLAFTLTNSTGAPNAANITFQDNLDAVLDGLTVVGDPPLLTGTCNGTLIASAGNTFLTYSGGSLAGGDSCTFSVTLDVPAEATPDTYSNTTESFSATFGGSAVALPNATDELVVSNLPSIVLSKSFDDDPAPSPGDTVTLTFDIGYAGPTDAINIAFTDDLDAALSGLVATGLPASVCGGTLSGTSTISFTGGTLPAGGTCSISVTLQVPATAADGTYTNTTGDISATVDTDPSLDLFGGSATDELTVGVVLGERNPPVANAGEDQTIECTNTAGEEVILDGRGSSDPDGDPLTFSWSDENGQEIATGDSVNVNLGVGVHTITLTVEDVSGLTDTDDVVITVEDSTAPVITLIGDNPLTIIRFSGPYVEPGATVADLCDPNPTLTIAGTVDTNLPGSYPITYDASDASGNDAVQVVRTVNVIDDPNALEHDFLFLVEKKIDAQHTIQAEGDFHSNKEIVIQHDGTVTGNLTAVEKITLQHDVTIDGDVTAGGDLNLSSNVTITGTATENASVDAIPLPTLSFSAGGDDIQVDEDETLALAPGSYGKVEVKKRATLQLSTGDYFFKELKTEDDAFLEVDLSTGPVEVNVEKKIDIHKDLTTTLSPLGDVDSQYLTFNSLEDITIGERSKLLGQLIAPEGKVDMKHDAMFRGSVCAEELTVHENSLVLHHDALTSLPKAAPATNTPTTPATATAIVEGAEVPTVLSLEGSYPNPFNPETTIRFAMPEAAHVSLVVYDVLGRQVRVLVDGIREAGSHEVTFEASNLPSGTYLYRLQTPGGSFTKTMLLLK